MNVSIVHHEPIHRAVWRSLDPLAKIQLLAHGDVVIDDEGLPRVADEILATTIRDVEEALGLRPITATTDERNALR